MANRMNVLENAMQFPPQRWAVVAAWLAFLGALGPVLWRLLMVAGVDMGWPDQSLYRHGGPLAYVLGLVLLEVACAALTLGLVQPWGERWPGWVPLAGGRPIPWRAVVAIASVGALLLSLIVGFFLVLFLWLGPVRGWRTPMTGTPAWACWLMAAFYGPSLLWPVGLWAAIVGFWRRHRRASRPPAAQREDVARSTRAADDPDPAHRAPDDPPRRGD